MTPKKLERTVYLAEPHGFCAGVRRALDMADLVLQSVSPPVYCLNEIVHNNMVVRDLQARGVIFVQEVEDIPPGAYVLFSAHGVSPDIRAMAEGRNLNIIDATCPFVGKVHREVQKFAEKGYTIILLGYRSHDEIVGVAGEAPQHVRIIENEQEAKTIEVPDPHKVALITQTTLSVEETERTYSVLASRFPEIETAPGDCICYATTNRQKAVVELASRCQLVLVLGSQRSSNTKRLAEVSMNHGCPSGIIDSIAALRSEDLSRIVQLGLTAGASTPECFVDSALQYLRESGFTRLEKLEVADETISFRIPAQLKERFKPA